jgi:hypothetical protein
VRARLPACVLTPVDPAPHKSGAIVIEAQNICNTVGLLFFAASHNNPHTRAGTT